MKRLYLFLFVTTFIVSFGFSQVVINDNFEVNVDQLTDKIDLWTQNLADRAESLADQLEGKKRGWKVVVGTPQMRAHLGMQFRELPEAKAKRLGFENIHGSIVVRVYQGSPAAAAGFESFDYLIGINNEFVSENRSFRDLLELYEPGGTVTVHAIRNDENLNIEVRLDDDGGFGYVFANPGFGWLGVSPAMQESAEDYDGVSVRVNRNSPASEMGLQDGDVIVAINGKRILEWDDLSIALNSSKPDDEIAIEFQRGGEGHTANGKLGSRFGSLHIEVPDVLFAPEHFEIQVPDDEEFEIAESSEPEEFWQDENKPFIGVYVEEISKEKAQKLGIDYPFGIYVSGIVPGSAAEKAGLKTFDYIFGIDEFRVGEEQRLADIMKRYKPGDNAKLQIVRQGKKQEVTIKFGKYVEHEEPMPANDCEDSFFGIIQEDDSANSQGIPISVVKGSTAEATGLQKSDILLTINGNRMIDWMDVKIAINQIKPGDQIAVTFERNGSKQNGKATMKSLAETKNCENCDCGDDADVVVKVGEVPSIKFNYKDIITKRQGESRSRTLDNVTMNVEDADGKLNELQAAGLVPSNITTGLQLTGFKLKADTDSGKFEFGFNLPSSGDLKIKVIDDINNTIYDAELIDYSGRFDDELDLAQKVPGVYSIVVIQNGKAVIKKVSLN